MKTNMLPVVVLIAGMAGSTVFSAELPAGAKAAIEKKFPGAKVDKVNSDVEKGKTIYTAEFTDKGVDYDVELTAEGEILSEAHDIKIGDLPAAVSEAVKKAHPKAKFEEAKIKDEKGTTKYEVEVIENGGKIVVDVSADGSKAEDEKGAK